MLPQSSIRLICVSIMLTSLLIGMRPGSLSAQTIKLNHPLQSDETIFQFALSPDGRHVIYMTGPYQGDTLDEHGLGLYSVALDGGISVQLNQPLPEDGRIIGFSISNNSQYVVYAASGPESNALALYSAPISGPADANVQISRQLPADQIVSSRFYISPDSQWVVYVVEDLNGFEIVGQTLFSVPLTGPAEASTQISASLSEGALYQRLWYCAKQ